MRELSVNNKLEKCGKKWLSPDLRYYPGIYMEGVRKTQKILVRTGSI
jgi:hypothetical protein